MLTLSFSVSFVIPVHSLKASFPIDVTDGKLKSPNGYEIQL